MPFCLVSANDGAKGTVKPQPLCESRALRAGAQSRDVLPRTEEGPHLSDSWWPQRRPDMTAYLRFLEDGAFARDHDRKWPVLERGCRVDWGAVWGGGGGGSLGLRW